LSVMSVKINDQPSIIEMIHLQFCIINLRDKEDTNETYHD
jgi:hypothetical protein